MDPFVIKVDYESVVPDFDGLAKRHIAQWLSKHADEADVIYCSLGIYQDTDWVTKNWTIEKTQSVKIRLSSADKKKITVVIDQSEDPFKTLAEAGRIVDLGQDVENRLALFVKEQLHALRIAILLKVREVSKKAEAPIKTIYLPRRWEIVDELAKMTMFQVNARLRYHDKIFVGLETELRGKSPQLFELWTLSV